MPYVVFEPVDCRRVGSVHFHGWEVVAYRFCGQYRLYAMQGYRSIDTLGRDTLGEAWRLLRRAMA